MPIHSALIPAPYTAAPIPPVFFFFFQFLLFPPTLNSPVCPFDPLLATLACCRAPAASSSAQVNLSSQFFTKLNFTLINNAHPVLLYEDVLRRIGASLFLLLLFSDWLRATVKPLPAFI